MDCNDALELVSYAVDNRLDDDQFNNFYTHIKDCKNCNKAFVLEKITKKLVAKRFGSVSSPDYLAERIISQVKVSNTTNSASAINILFTKLLQRHNLYYALPAALVIIIFLFVFFPKSHQNYLPSIDSNIVQQVHDNFSALSCGKIKLDVSTNEPETLESYFKNSVNYNFKIPKPPGCLLLGGTITQFENEKLSHILYKNDENTIYFSIIDFRCIAGNKTITLSDNALDELRKNGLHYAGTHKFCSVILWLVDSTLYTAAAEMEKDKLISFISNLEKK